MDNKDLAKYVGGRIRYYRKKLKLTQDELGQKIGVKHNTISDYERGHTSPEQDALFELSDIFGIRIDDLFPQRNEGTDDFERALKMTKDFDLQDMNELNELIQKALSLDKNEREKLLNRIRFEIDYLDK